MASANPPVDAGRRILVVEDEYLVADDIVGILERLGYEVLGPVPTVDRALEMITRETMDAVLLDANLGGASSAPIATELATRGLPFIVVTGYGNLELASALQTAPRVTKPFTPGDLAAALANTFAA